MNKTQTLFSLSTVAIIAGFLAIPMTVSGAQASSTSALMNCASNNKGKTIDCCESVVRGSVPIWMKTTGRNCQTAVKCAGSYATTANYRRCHVVIWQDEGPNDRTPKARTRDNRSFN